MKGCGGAIGASPEAKGSSRFSHATSQDEAPVKDARSPQNAAHFGSPAPRWRGAFGVLDRRFAGRFRVLSSMRRTSATEEIMSNSPHPHAAFDRFPALVRGLDRGVWSRGNRRRCRALHRGGGSRFLLGWAHRGEAAWGSRGRIRGRRGSAREGRGARLLPPPLLHRDLRRRCSATGLLDAATAAF